MINEIVAANAPCAVGPYSQGIMVSGVEKTIYVSGQLPISPDTADLVSQDIKEQTRVSILNVLNVLKAEDLDLSNVVKTTVYLSDMNDFAAMNSVYAEYFNKPYPARMAFQADALAKGAKVEIEAIAVK